MGRTLMQTKYLVPVKRGVHSLQKCGSRAGITFSQARSTTEAVLSYHYDEIFFDYLERGSLTSAREVVPILAGALTIRSVLDVGCGRGVWLSQWASHGAQDIIGVDGGYVNVERLAIPRERFRPLDLSDSFDLGRTFDLVECLEVGEHIPQDRSETLIDNLVRHGQMVFFSAAVSGQGGEFHVNEQPLCFWRDLFRVRDYHAFDFVRPLLGRSEVEPWYRYNALLYVRADAIPKLSDTVAATRIRDGVKIPDLSPLHWRLRRAVLRLLSTGTVTKLAIVKHQLMLARQTYFRNKI